MKKDLSLLILAAQQQVRESIHQHRCMAAACQQAQQELTRHFRLHLGHARRWYVNGAVWQLHYASVWLSSNIEFSQPTLTVHIQLATEDNPLARLRLEMQLPLGHLPADRPFPADLDLPCTLPATRPVTLYPHYRAGSWKTYPEITLR